MFNDAALVIAANAIAAAITHAQAHSADPGALGTNAPLGTRVAITESVDADGDITFTAAFTGLPANQSVTWVSYWSSAGTGTPATGGTNYGRAQITTGDVQANAAGAITVSVTETSTAT